MALIAAAVHGVRVVCKVEQKIKAIYGWVVLRFRSAIQLFSNDTENHADPIHSDILCACKIPSLTSNPTLDVKQALTSLGLSPTTHTILRPLQITTIQVLNVAGVGGFTDGGMSILMPRAGPTLQDITLDGATSLGEEEGSQAHKPSATR